MIKTIGLKLMTYVALSGLVVITRGTGALQQNIISTIPAGITGQAVMTANGDVVIVSKQPTQTATDTPNTTSPSPSTTTKTQKTTKTTTQPGSTPTTPTTTTPPPPATEPPATGGPPTPPPPPPPPQPVYTFANGTYTANGSYNAPSGNETIRVQITVFNDEITASTVTALSSNGTTLTYQNDFRDTHGPQVIGVKLDLVNLGKVSISSLTPIGFNNAVNAIEAAARI